MQKLPLIIVLLLFSSIIFAQSPHGEELKIDCAECHTTKGWAFSPDSSSFSHSLQTQFILEGQHQVTQCRQCHTSLVFSDTQSTCFSCHTDMHQATLGNDCAKCHNANSWIVENITELHQNGRFPLLGAHNTADCSDCHKSASLLEFEPLGIECIDCHRQNYLATTNPNHIQAGLSENCIECHNLNAFEWSSSGFSHNFFPLTKGHEISDCSLCHGNDIFEPINNDCYSCHASNYNAASNPSHQGSAFSTSCEKCHTTAPDWKPAKFNEHDQFYFPIYSGNHNGEWDNCSDCHTQPENYSVFTCTNCHEHEISKMNNEHKGVGGYSSSSYSCFACHPNGGKHEAFNHNNTSFPLTGAHLAVECLSCHANGYAGTATDCVACHTENYNLAADPNHLAAGIETSCESCHSTSAWKPSAFDHTNTGFSLTGGHSGKQCSQCHQGTTIGAGPDCYDCHQQNYNEAENHLLSGFPHDCTQCHSTTNWQESTFNHNATNFPLTGAHIATGCLSCHTNGYAGTATDCAACHTENYNLAADPNHLAAGIETSCEKCHSTSAWQPSDFDHLASTGFPLTGGHSGKQCSECHLGTTIGAGPDCFDCHQQNYNEAENHLTGGFPHDCTQCHSTTNWGEANFDHNATNFPLTGAHIATGCLSCHTNGYAGTDSDCAACHTENYNLAADPNHLAAGIETSCESCHSTSAWKPSAFDHTNTGFSLTGGHSGKQCSLCHQGTTIGAGPGCYDCHSQNYNQAENHLSGGYPHECTQCHNTNSWGEAFFDHNATNFPLSGAHLAVECLSCHTNGYAGTATDCAACHTENYNLAADPNHLAAGIETSCENCHSTSTWKPSAFDHTNTGFSLTGGHSGKQCSVCHLGTTTGAGPDCFDCHQQNYNEAENHLLSGFPHDCTQCHSTTNWQESTFNHNATNFPLTGAHIATGCLSCHTNGYAGTATDCAACHTENYNLAADPNHLAAGIETSCEKCHSTSAWQPSDFDHLASTGFPLTGGHSGKQCSECHLGTTIGAGPDCYDCHQQNYNEAENHLTGGFPHDCTQCHSTTNWQESTFNHNATNFPLTGAHIATGCLSCHTNGYAGTATDCAACHTENYNLAADPNHLAAGIETSCESCHSTSAWQPSDFDHLASTGFPLTGGHSGKQCSLCHQGTTIGAGPGCYDCHSQNYNQAENHLSGGYPHECTQCHNTNSWGEASFDHNATNFPLSGAHLAVECLSCHTNGYAGTPSDCASCHTGNYNLAADPNHIEAGIETACEKCHSTSAWKPSDFDHMASTGFPLTGGHSGKQCSVCHLGTTTGAGPDCYDCHQQNYNEAENHLLSGFPHDCTQCHSTTNWQESTFNHNATNFPLTGAHIATGCLSCHTNGYAGTPSDCAACHTNDYNTTTNPSHLNLALSTSCEGCHTTNIGWEPALFPVHQNYYALIGAHAAIANDCSLCHNGNYTNTPNTCYGCHSSDYNNTSDPAHATAKFPTDCESCHTENAWSPSTFDHDAQYFPIYSGKHRGEWNTCADCHTVPTNYTIFSCIDCHEHNRTSMDSEHREVNNYVYNSTNCLACHPIGRADD